MGIGVLAWVGCTEPLIDMAVVLDEGTGVGMGVGVLFTNAPVRQPHNNTEIRIMRSKIGNLWFIVTKALIFCSLNINFL
ncbi:hypothetical protein [Methanocella conradii]|uniref:hypothetical protein n=1 Tax=Methanocella conradii TaxID=1175444 RepID=UPI0024B33684|nr:hypothetical protein [Methanocella conradii]MDI6896820.1 hypothetical protein [Methanocella conradii]